MNEYLVAIGLALLGVSTGWQLRGAVDLYLARGRPAILTERRKE